MNKMRYKKETYDLFDEWNEFSAYVFGFWLADGHITLNHNRGKPYKILEIRNTDSEIMEELASRFGTKTCVCCKETKRTKEYLRIRLYADKLWDFCYSIVGSTRKSHSRYRLPNFGSNFRHFVRGFFDGDGSICWKSYKNRHGKITKALQTSFTAGKETNHLEEIKKRIREAIPVGNKKIVGKDARKLVFNQYDSMLLCEWMYKDATIFMKRKKKIWDEADKEKLAKSQKYFSNKV